MKTLRKKSTENCYRKYNENYLFNKNVFLKSCPFLCYIIINKIISIIILFYQILSKFLLKFSTKKNKNKTFIIAINKNGAL